ncbi:MAG: hypothetical protein ACK5Q5_12205 [Planctomycetaceae bacterium]
MAAPTPTQDKPSTEINAVDLQSELLGMLNRVGSSAPPKPTPLRPTIQSAAGEAPAVKAATSIKPAPKPVDEPVDPNVTCVKCGNQDSWGTASWCPKCGYYPGLGHDGEIPQEESDGIEDLTFFDLCPPWALQLVGGLIFIVVGTLMMERFLDGNVGWLSLMSMVQLAFGAILVLFAHKQAIMLGLNDPGCPSVMSLITYPPAVWMPVLKNLRERAHLLVTMAWGLCACAMALSMYGPIHMSEVKKEIVESKKSKTSFLGKILGTLAQISNAVQGANNQNLDPNHPDALEDAIGGFAGITTEQGGIGNVVDGTPTGHVDAKMQQAASEAADEMIAVGSGGSEIPADGGDNGSLDGAVGKPTDGTSRDVDSDNPEKVVALANGSATTRSATAAIPSATVAGAPTSPAGLPRSTTTSKRGGAGLSNGSTRSRTGQSSTSAAENVGDSRQAVVFGYLLSVGGEIRTLLIANMGSDGRPRFAGKLRSDSMQADQWEQIVSSLPKLRVSRPLVACPNAGYWVAPRLLLTISASRWSQTGPTDAQVLSVEVR